MRRLEIGGLVVVALVAAGAGPARAQISPGLLSTPHQALEGNGRCFECHGGKRDAMDKSCLECHAEIRGLIDADRGLHAREGNARCASCHPDHAGRDFALVRWEGGSSMNFDHARTGWRLEGKHAVPPCASCHRPDRQSPTIVSKANRADPGRSWLGLDPACVRCHQDPHASRLGADCERCHTATGWRDTNTSTFDHGRTRYPLVGKHAGVACTKCHDATPPAALAAHAAPAAIAAPEMPSLSRPAFDRCSACHADPHAGQIARGPTAGDCSTCHTLEGFRPATFDGARHRSTHFALEGAHARVPCRECHDAPAANRAKFGSAGFAFRPSHERCGDCHRDAHGEEVSADFAGAPGSDCASCHHEGAWRPSTLDAFRHAELGFALEDGHRELACARCHGPERPTLAPPPRTANLGPARRLLASTEKTCSGCHADPHLGRYTNGWAAAGDDPCRGCHDAGDFRRSRVDVERHANFAFALRDAHQAVPCLGCHRELERAPAHSSLVAAAVRPEPLELQKLGQRCADCHRDPHAGQFAERAIPLGCESCHSEARFRPAERFDHTTMSRFALTGRHVGLLCAECHPKAKAPDGSERTKFIGIGVECRDCHREIPQ